MLYFLGDQEPREWVVWDTAVPMSGTWELMELEWLDDGASFKIRGDAGQYVKWAVSGFIATSLKSQATEFVLREV